MVQLAFKFKHREKKLGNHVFLCYLLKELLVYFSIAFLFFFLIFFVNQILLMTEELLKKRVPLFDVVKLITYSLPFVIAQSAPFATLVGFLMCIGRLMTDNEILIFRATGRSYVTILFPVLILGILISIVSFFVNDYLLPLGTVKYNKLYQSILISNPAVEIESNSIKRTQDSTLVIGEVKDRNVSDLLLFDKSEDDTQRIIIAGNTYIAEPSDPSVIMQLKMDETTAVFFNRDKRTNYDFLESENSIMNIFASSIFKPAKTTNPREMTCVDLKKKIDEMKKDENTNPLLMNIYKLEFNKKFSLPFGSLFFAMLAMPIAILFGKHNGQTIGLIIGVVVSLIYWAMLILGQTFGFRNGLNGFWAMWFPNILVGGTGIIFYLRLHKK